MKINTIKLDPFGGLSNKKLTLNPGLNVVLGPNEAGKSTFFNAIQRALLTPVKLRKNSAEWIDMQRFIPLGGDRARVEMIFSCNDSVYTVLKTWGANQSAELTLPDGAVLGDEGAVMARIKELLPAGEATCRTVLMATQNGLMKTLDEIKSDGSTLQSLDDILRSALGRTDGVSVDELLRKLKALLEEYLSRWDRFIDAPENNRGINNPYVNNVGKILRAFYDREQLQKELEQAQDFEEQLDKVNSRILVQQTSLTAVEDFLKDNQAAADSARERRVLEAELSGIQSRVEVMQKDNQEWPVARSNHTQLLEEIPAHKKRKDDLENEERAAKAAETGKVFRQRYTKAKPANALLNELEKKLQETNPLLPAVLDQLRRAKERRDTAEIALAAGKLTLKFTANKKITITVTKDMDPATEVTVQNDTAETITAGARLCIGHPDWNISVMSGEQQDIEATEKAVVETRTALQNLLKTHSVNSFEEAVEAARLYSEATRAVEQQLQKLKLILEGGTYEELEQKIASLGETADTRSQIDIVKELGDTANILLNKQQELRQLEKQLTEFTKKYEDPDALFLNVAEAVKNKKELFVKIKELAPLPAGATNAVEFVAEFDRIDAECRKLQKQVGDLLIERATLQGTAPEQSSEELEALLSDAKVNFENVKVRALTLLRVLEVAIPLSQSTDTDTFNGLKNTLVTYTGAMTSGRHTEIDMPNKMPSGFKRKDGLTLGYDLLSSGTKDVLALSLRLAMTGYFLQTTEGFMIMDDPLVDLDPVRQANAAQVIKKFAEKTQVIVFTCHPGHAALFGEGAVVEVG